jgi:hypothetical protein
VIKDPNQKIRKPFLSLKTQLALEHQWVPLLGKEEGEKRKPNEVRVNPMCHV